MKLTPPDILSIIPHRYENMLIDSCVIDENNNGEFSLCIQNPDDLNRTIFLLNQSLPIPYLSELAALASIVSSGKIKPGTLAFFAAITNMTCLNPSFSLNDTITGQTMKISEKAGFFKYKFAISSSKGGEANGQIMAYYNTSNVTSDNSLPKPLSEFPIQLTQTNGEHVPSMPNRDSFMTFIETYYGSYNDANSHVFGYQYPTNHPLIQGHFPGNPVMMGVCQWQMIEDAIYFLCNKDILPKAAFTLNANLCKSDTSIACEFKGLTISNTTSRCFTSHAKKILFKQPIKPGDKLYLLINIESIHQ